MIRCLDGSNALQHVFTMPWAARSQHKSSSIGICPAASSPQITSWLTKYYLNLLLHLYMSKSDSRCGNCTFLVTGLWLGRLRRLSAGLKRGSVHRVPTHASIEQPCSIRFLRLGSDLLLAPTIWDELLNKLSFQNFQKCFYENGDLRCGYCTDVVTGTWHVATFKQNEMCCLTNCCFRAASSTVCVATKL